MKAPCDGGGGGWREVGLLLTVLRMERREEVSKSARILEDKGWDESFLK